MYGCEIAGVTINNEFVAVCKQTIVVAASVLPTVVVIIVGVIGCAVLQYINNN